MEKDILKEILERSNIYIFGAGKVGQIVIEYFLMNHPDISIDSIIVSDVEDNPYSIYGIPVTDINSINNKKEAVILVALLEKSQDNIVTILTDAGFVNIIKTSDQLVNNWTNKIWNCDNMPRNFLLNKRYIQPYIQTMVDIEKSKGNNRGKIRDIINKGTNDLLNEDKLHISRLVVVLGTKCSLNCKECNNLMPYFKPQKDLDKDKIIESLEKLLKVTDSILKCELGNCETTLLK